MVKMRAMRRNIAGGADTSPCELSDCISPATDSSSVISSRRAARSSSSSAAVRSHASRLSARPAISRPSPETLICAVRGRENRPPPGSSVANVATNRSAKASRADTSKLRCAWCQLMPRRSAMRESLSRKRDSAAATEIVIPRSSTSAANLVAACRSHPPGSPSPRSRALPTASCTGWVDVRGQIRITHHRDPFPHADVTLPLGVRCRHC